MNTKLIMKKSLFLLLVIVMTLAVITFSGCSADKGASYDDIGNGSDNAVDGSVSNPQVVLNQTNRKIIYSVDIELVTKDYDNTIDIIYDFIFSNPTDNHWISHDNESSYGENNKTREMTLRIKTEKLNDFLSAIPDMGELESYNLSTEDITYNYAQTQAEKNALEDERTYYQGLLADLEEQSLSFSDNYRLIQELSTKITELNSKIRLINDELTKYDNELEFSTVKLIIRSFQQQEETPKVELSFGAKIKKAFFDTTGFLGKAFKWLFIAFIYVFPYVLIAGAILFLTVFINKKVTAKRKGREEMKKIKDEMTKK